jgi:hypothetical protein
MDEQPVLQTLRANQIDVREVLKGTWILCDSPDAKGCDPFGSVSFEKGKLSLVSKWWISTRDASALVSAFFGVAKDFEKRGNTHCELKTEENFEPAGEARDVLFRCGGHMSLGLFYGHAPNDASSSQGNVQQILSVK